MPKQTLAQIIKAMEEMGEEDKQSILEQEFMTNADIEPLVSNKDKLLKELKDAKTKLKANKMDENDTELLQLLKNYGIMQKEELDTIVSSGTSDLEKSQLDNKRLTAQLEKAMKDSELIKTSFESERTQRLATAKKNAINSELSKLNIIPDSMDILTSYFDNKLSANLSDDGSVNVVSNDDDITSINDVFSTWSETEQSKNFIKAPTNNGGGASGANGNGGGDKLTLEQIAQIPNQTERLKAMNDNGL